MAFERIRPPREQVASLGVSSGVGVQGLAFAPEDREFRGLQEKARSVLQGRASFKKHELDKLMALLLVGNDS